MYQLNDHCYHFEKITYPDGLLDESVDATYIIHLEGNGRLESIHEQLRQYHPTKIVYIIFNKGFEKCDKHIHEKLPAVDLTDAFLHAFKHAKNNKYENILVLEDDFMFSEKINDPSVASRINQFIVTKQHTEFIYLLGCLPFFQIPYDLYTNIVFVSAGTHAVIYSDKYITQLLEVDQKSISDWDLQNNLILNRYTYYEPVCYQLCPETENSKNWGKSQPDYIWFITVYPLKLIIKMLGLDKSVEPGYSIMYTASKLLFWMSVFIIIILTFLYKILKNKSILRWIMKK